MKATETETEKKNPSVVLPRAHDGTLARIDAIRIEEELKRESRRDFREYATSATNFTTLLAGLQSQLIYVGTQQYLSVIRPII